MRKRRRLPTPEPVETSWYADKPTFNPGIIDSTDNLFNQDVEGIINEGARAIGNYDVFSESRNIIFQHQEYTPSNLRLDLDLSSDQYRTLVDQYGDMISVTMETIDLDQNGAMDKVVVKYVGSDSVLEFTDGYKQGWTAADYMSENIDL